MIKKYNGQKAEEKMLVPHSILVSQKAQSLIYADILFRDAYKILKIQNGKSCTSCCKNQHCLSCCKANITISNDCSDRRTKILSLRSRTLVCGVVGFGATGRSFAQHVSFLFRVSEKVNIYQTFIMFMLPPC